MPTAVMEPPYDVAAELASSYGEPESIQDLKGSVIQLLSSSCLWDNVLVEPPMVVADTRPESMLRRVDFDYSPDSHGEITDFVEAPPDDDDNFW